MNSFPAFFPLEGKVVVVVGEGEPAEAKLRLLSQGPASVRRIQVPEAYDPAAYSKARLAFIALEDRVERQQAAEAARQAGVPVNVVDDPELGDFSTPALVIRGDLTIAIGTGGSAPVMASLLRSQLEGLVSPALGVAARMIGKFQPQIRAAYPDLAQRRAFLRRLLRSQWLQELEADQSIKAEQILADGLEQAELATGALHLVRGDVEPDQITLGEARALSDTDVLILEGGNRPAVVNLARRDAIRRASGSFSAGDLELWLGQGQQIVWLTTSSGWPEGLAHSHVVQDLRPGLRRSSDI